MPLQLTSTYLYRLAGESLALCYRAAPGYEARLTDGASLVLSGEPVSDLNYAIIDAGSHAEGHMREFVQVAKSRKIPMLVLLSPEAAPLLKAAAQELRLKFEGYFPFMVYRPENPRFDESSFQISRVDNPGDLKASNAAAASAFGIPLVSVDRAFGPAFLEGPGVDLFIARQGEVTVSTVQTTRSGLKVGIWAMATPPDQRRKGAGRALLNYVIAYHCQRGADLFYLVATPAGKPLYDRVGFQTMTQAEVRVFQPEG